MAFGFAMMLMLASAASFVYVRLRADLDDNINASLRARVAALVEPPGEPTLAGVALADPQETFTQLLSPTGELLGSVGSVRGPALHAAEARRALSGRVTLERRFPGVDGPTRILAVSEPGRRSPIIVVGQSLLDRNDALTSVVTSFLVGGAVALVLASLIGYLVATAAFAPVDAMRRRAREVSLHPSDEGLPLPAARDEIRQLAETLNEMLARLRAAFERESRFVADASHELRTPIATIKLELEAALQHSDPATTSHTALVAAVEECDRLGQLAEDLLVIARTKEGKLPVQPEPVEVKMLLAHVADRFVARAERRGRVITIDADDDLVVRADPLRLQQALGNLVDNALRYGDGAIVLTSRGSDTVIEIEVSDEGAGFPAEFAPHAFERFARASTSRSGDGVGLGLAIVQAIAAGHDGSATIVTIAPPTVRIRLPISG